MAREKDRIPEETVERLRSLFPRTRYHVHHEGRKYVLRSSNDLRTELFLDGDGSILGKPGFQLNFWVFPKDNGDVNFSDWQVEAVREWCATIENSVTKREQDSALARKLRKYWPGVFVEWLLKKDPRVVVYNSGGAKVTLISDDTKANIRY